MTLPVVERIASEIQTRLNPVAPDRAKSIGQATVLRIGRTLETAASVVIQQQPTRPLPRLDCPGNPCAKAFEVTFNIQCLIENKNTEGEFATQCNLVASDVIRLISSPSVNPSFWWNFGGLAIDSVFGSVRDLVTEIGVHGGVIVPLTVKYRVSENDHTQVR